MKCGDADTSTDDYFRAYLFGTLSGRARRALTHAGVIFLSHHERTRPIPRPLRRFNASADTRAPLRVAVIILNRKLNISQLPPRFARLKIDMHVHQCYAPDGISRTDDNARFTPSPSDAPSSFAPDLPCYSDVNLSTAQRCFCSDQIPLPI